MKRYDSEPFHKGFEKVWNRLKNTPRGKVIKFTRKYVAKLFYFEGLNHALKIKKGR